MFKRILLVVVALAVFSYPLIWAGVVGSTQVFSKEVPHYCLYPCHDGSTFGMWVTKCELSIWGFCTPTGCPSYISICGPLPGP